MKTNIIKSEKRYENIIAAEKKYENIIVAEKNPTSSLKESNIVMKSKESKGSENMIVPLMCPLKESRGSEYVIGNLKESKGSSSSGNNRLGSNKNSDGDNGSNDICAIRSDYSAKSLERLPHEKESLDKIFFGSTGNREYELKGTISFDPHKLLSIENKLGKSEEKKEGCGENDLFVKYLKEKTCKCNNHVMLIEKSNSGDKFVNFLQQHYRLSIMRISN